MDLPVKDSGNKQQFPTGSQRDSSAGKGRYDLLPLEGIHELAKLFEKGAIKYDARNWEKGQPMSQYFNSALRHAFKWLGGHRDEDHLVAACWNLLCAVTTRERIAEGRLPAALDDLPKMAFVPSEIALTTNAEQLPSPPPTPPEEEREEPPFPLDLHYRWVEPGEILKHGDEYWTSECGYRGQTWRATSIPGAQVSLEDQYLFRRRTGRGCVVADTSRFMGVAGV